MIKTIQQEIDALNWKIDVKIIKGLPYRTESRRHKFLVSQLKALSRARQSYGWLSRTANVMASFVL